MSLILDFDYGDFSNGSVLYPPSYIQCSSTVQYRCCQSRKDLIHLKPPWQLSSTFTSTMNMNRWYCHTSTSTTAALRVSKIWAASLIEKVKPKNEMTQFGTRVDHELMVQSRGGHSSIVTATLEHWKKCVFQADVAVVINDQVAKLLKSRLLHTSTRCRG